MTKPNKLLSATVLGVLTTLAANSATKENIAAKAEKRAYVETSYLIAPRQVGDYVLEDARYDKDQKYSGAGFRYALDGHQEIRIDVYVYPAGKMSQDLAMTQGMEAFRKDLARAVDAKTYTNLIVNGEQEFLLADAPKPSNAESSEDRNAAKILAAAAAATHPTGRKLALTMNLQPRDLPMHSSGHLFYKQLYYFKVRATAAQERITAEQFEAIVDRAARALVPVIEVANVGDCANAVIHLSTNASPEEGAVALVSQAALHRSYNCYTTAKSAEIDKKSANSEIVDISYEPQEWKSE